MTLHPIWISMRKFLFISVLCTYMYFFHLQKYTHGCRDKLKRIEIGVGGKNLRIGQIRISK